MPKLKILAIALLLTSLAIGTAFAKRQCSDGPFDHDGGRQGKLEQLKEKLDLTTQQETAIKKIITAHREETGALHKAAKQNREEIHQAFGADVLDEARLRELVRAQTEQRLDLMVARHAMRAEINKILTPEQLEKHDALRKERKGHRGDHHGAGPSDR